MNRHTVDIAFRRRRDGPDRERQDYDGLDHHGRGAGLVRDPFPGLVLRHRRSRPRDVPDHPMHLRRGPRMGCLVRRRRRGHASRHGPDDVRPLRADGDLQRGHRRPCVRFRPPHVVRPAVGDLRRHDVDGRDEDPWSGDHGPRTGSPIAVADGRCSRCIDRAAADGVRRHARMLRLPSRGGPLIRSRQGMQGAVPHADRGPRFDGAPVQGPPHGGVYRIVRVRRHRDRLRLIVRARDGRVRMLRDPLLHDRDARGHPHIR